MSIIQSYINKINSDTASANALNPDDFIEEAKKKNSTKKQADIDAVNAGYDKQISNTQALYDNKINNANAEYTNEYERNAVQKLINEKQIAERNANLGLTDSGLNRTQQTAVQLSYANQKGDIDLARQKTLDSLGLSLTSAITSLQNEKANSVRNIENEWDNLSTEQGINAYNSKLNYYNNLIAADSEALASIYEAENSVSKTPTVSYGNGGTSSGGYILQTSGGLLSRDYIGSLSDNNIDVIYNTNGTTTYVDNNSGKKTTFAREINPYTGTRNKDLLDKDGYYDPSKAFSNGYQPNNINGEKLKATDATWIVNGCEQKIFTLKSDGKYYIWSGESGKYQKLTDEEAASVKLY